MSGSLWPLPAAAQMLTHGPIVGAVTPTTARVFLRTDVETRGKLRVEGVAGDVRRLAFRFRTSLSRDLTTQVSLSGLLPGATYSLRVRIDGLWQPQTGTFKTFAAAESTAPFSFVVLNDFAGPLEAPAPGTVFALADGEGPDFVIIGGDFDHSGPDSLDEKRQMFKRLYDPQLMPEFVEKILRRYPVAHMWDDHDYGRNNGNKLYPRKQLALQVLTEYFPVYPVSAFGDWQKFSYAYADFFLLDSRSQRDPNDTPDGPGKSMLDGDDLGPAGQLFWLQQGLLTSRARWKFILTPVPFNPTVPKADSWAGFQYERAELVDFIRRNDIQGVVLISGDLHAGAIDDGTNSDFPEMLVPAPNFSSLSPGHCLSATDIGQWSVGTYRSKRSRGRPCNGYGLVKVTTSTATLQVKDDTGAVRIEYIVP